MSSGTVTKVPTTDHVPLPDLISTEERVAELAKLVSQLPLPNYSLLRALTSHLILIVAHSDQNKMSLRNIGIVFSPTLGKSGREWR